MEEKAAHNLTLEGRKYLALSGASDVAAFNENEIRLRLLSGEKMTVSGEKLQIVGFDKKTGECRLSGKINAVKYTDAGLSSPRRFFR
ncbi:MAG: YabP/YqfC family sporulation protein [Clostridia bacterium]|nr:YabP/YqfC family sporulation protein [Clostridia bacterium]